MKWYTRARKFPQLIGRTPDGTRIPGGPYTYLQVAAGVGMAAVLAATTGLWARGALLFNATVFLGLTVGAVYLAGQLPPGMRNPLLGVAGFFRAFGRGYKINGSSLPRLTRNSRTALGLVTLFEVAAEECATEPEPEPVVAEIAPVPGPGRPALSNVQRLLLGEQS